MAAIAVEAGRAQLEHPVRPNSLRQLLARRVGLRAPSVHDAYRRSHGAAGEASEPALCLSREVGVGGAHERVGRFARCVEVRRSPRGGPASKSIRCMSVITVMSDRARAPDVTCHGAARDLAIVGRTRATTWTTGWDPAVGLPQMRARSTASAANRTDPDWRLAMDNTRLGAGGAAVRRRHLAAPVPLRARTRRRPQGPRRRPGRTDRRSPTSTRSGSPCRPTSATSRSASSSRSARPAALPTVLYVHGGGWILGNAGTHDRLVRELAVGVERRGRVRRVRPLPGGAVPGRDRAGLRDRAWITDDGPRRGPRRRHASPSPATRSAAT